MAIGLSPKTQASYLNAINRLVEHYQKSPTQLSSDDLRHYFVQLMERKKVSPATMAVYRAGIRFLVERTLGEHWPSLDLFRFKRPRKLPDVLTVEEVKTILDAVRVKRSQICLKTIYACGLRLSEGVSLTVNDIDGARHLLKVCGGKGRKDRYVPIPVISFRRIKRLLASLPPNFIFVL